MNTEIIAVKNQKEILMKIPEMIHDVMNASHCCASDMTHALCALGGGDMGTGIVAFGRAFQADGIIKGSLATGLVFAAGTGIKKLYRYHKSRPHKAKSETSGSCTTVRKKHPKGGDNMHKIIAKSDEQLGIALRLAYAYGLPYSVEGIKNDDHKVEFHISVTADDEEFESFKRHCEIQFAAED